MKGFKGRKVKFVGRDTDLFDQKYDQIVPVDAIANHERRAFIVGDWGSGKTALVKELHKYYKRGLLLDLYTIKTDIKLDEYISSIVESVPIDLEDPGVSICFDNINRVKNAAFLQEVYAFVDNNPQLSIYITTSIDWLMNNRDFSSNLGMPFVHLDAKLDSDENPERHPIDISKALGKRKIWLAGHTWHNGDQIPRFIEENSWQNGKEYGDENAINSTKKGDLVFLKSTFTQGGESILRVKGVGVVFHNWHNGHDLHVNWNLFDSHIDFPVLGKFRRTYQQLTLQHYDEFLLRILDDYPRLFGTIEDLEEEISKDLVNKIDELLEKDTPTIEQKKEQYITEKPDMSYWFYNNNSPAIELQLLKAGDTHVIGSSGNNGRRSIYENFFSVNVDDAVIGYQGRETNSALNIFRVTKAIDDEYGGELVLETKKILETRVPWDVISELPSMSNSELLNNPVADLVKLTGEQYKDILMLSNSQDDEVSKEKSYIQESKIANYAADIEDGEDYLSINKDVEAFAKVIAADKFSPPLAIGLFGKWGMGKSFFMKKLKAKIETYSNHQDETSDYCNGIAHIHFNAWSYMDANLWASFVTKIFEGLHEYISDHTKAKGEKEQIEKIFSEKLQVIREEREAYEERKSSIENEIDTLDNDRKDLQGKLDEEIEEIKNQTLDNILEPVLKSYDLKSEVDKALKGNETIEKLNADIDELIPEKYRENPELAIQHLNRTGTYVNEIIQDRRQRNWLLFGVGITIIVLCAPLFMTSLTEFVADKFILFAQFGLSAIAIITPIVSGYKKVYEKIKPIVGELWNVKKTFDQKVENAKFTYKQKKEALEITIRRSSEEIASIDQRMYDLDKEVKELEFKLEHGLSTQTLYSFIEKRAASEDYQKHLGIISTIRHDFEVLSTLFTDAKSELNNETLFKEYSKNKLQRIVLYVDDLDRCPEERVVQVLEAVNLLMAFPLFVVVVGVDPRWVKNALLKKYKLQFGDSSVGTEGAKPIEAANYLEKIFQIPFHLQQAEDKEVKSMLFNLTKSNIKYEDEDIEEVLQGARSVSPEGKTVLSRVVEDETSQDMVEDSVNDDEQDIKEQLQLMPEEVELMQELSEVIGNNPRAIKRFVNVYQIVRAHEGLTIESNGTRTSDFAQIMFLLALPLGPFKELIPYLHGRIESEDNKERKFESFLQLADVIDLYSESKNDHLNKLKHELDVRLSETRASRYIQAIDCNSLRKHNKFIKRFTFAELY